MFNNSVFQILKYKRIEKKTFFPFVDTKFFVVTIAGTNINLFDWKKNFIAFASVKQDILTRIFDEVTLRVLVTSNRLLKIS